MIAAIQMLKLRLAIVAQNNFIGYSCFCVRPYLLYVSIHESDIKTIRKFLILSSFFVP